MSNSCDFFKTIRGGHPSYYNGSSGFGNYQGAEENSWNKRIKEIWKKFQKGTEKDFSSFKVFFRSFKVLRPDLYEETYKSMKAKELLLEYEDIEYPENVISYSQRKAYKKKLLKQKDNGS